MIRLELTQQTENFRTELREWLKSNVPPVIKDNSLETFINQGRIWQNKLSSGGWVAVHWPKEFGGRSLSLVEEAIVQEELVRAKAPQVLGLFGLTMVGPVLIAHGTPEQKTQFLPKIRTGEEIWCQGFSEPGAGSDLAAIRTRAVPCEGGFKVSGQKVWTSFAQIANFCFTLVRTSDEQKKHQGMTYLLIDMRSKGITVRPLKQISGDDEFNEVFFDDVFVPSENVVGKVGEGWNIAISTLMYERVVLTFARQLQSEVALRQMITQFKDHQDETLIKKLENCVATACAVRALSFDHLLSYAKGVKPGPEGSMDKLFWSQSFQEICSLALEFLGPNGVINENDDVQNSVYIHRYLYSRGRTIAAGTSEVQKGIIAERILGLPRSR